jgi:repressor LexA
MFFTEKQLRIMKFIKQYRAERGISPTMEEIAAKLNVTKITVYDHLNQLERKGALKRARFRARSVELLVGVGDQDTPLVLPLISGAKRASPGEPVQADETLDLKSIFPLSEKCFAFRVPGDSMIGDGIRAGDYVIVERRADVGNGNVVVVALPDGRLSIQRIFRERSRVRLQPSNGSRKAIYARAKEIVVHGVVIGLLRNFSPGRN